MSMQFFSFQNQLFVPHLPSEQLTNFTSTMISSKRFACSTDIIRLWSFIFIVSITSSVVVYGAAVQCDDDELDEAQKSFR